jgi:hypothetical protein
MEEETGAIRNNGIGRFRVAFGPIFGLKNLLRCFQASPWLSSQLVDELQTAEKKAARNVLPDKARDQAAELFFQTARR